MMKIIIIIVVENKNDDEDDDPDTIKVNEGQKKMNFESCMLVRIHSCD